MTNLLILSSDTGEGHNSAAAAIEHAARAAGLGAVVRKPLEESGKLNKTFANLYNVLLTYRHRWISQYFWLINRVGPNEGDAFYAKVRPFIGRFIEAANPDVVLSVHPMLNHFIQRFAKEERRELPCYTFLTDPFPPFWRGWASPYVDRYFVPTDEALLALTAMGIAAWRIERVPMPVRPQFTPARPADIENFRRTLGLQEPCTILINGGARGGGPLLQIHDRVRAAAPNSNILIVCGQNSRMQKQIEERRDTRTRTFGFVQDIYQHIQASDLVITKPGAMSTYEALACGVPVMLVGINGLMPQESGLFRAAVRYDFGYAVETIAELDTIIRLGPRQWKRKRECVVQFYRSSQGQEIIEKVQTADVGV